VIELLAYAIITIIAIFAAIIFYAANFWTFDLKGAELKEEDIL
jgi:hypothetical protein